MWKEKDGAALEVAPVEVAVTQVGIESNFSLLMQ